MKLVTGGGENLNQENKNRETIWFVHLQTLNMQRFNFVYVWIYNTNLRQYDEYMHIAGQSEKRHVEKNSHFLEKWIYSYKQDVYSLRNARFILQKLHLRENGCSDYIYSQNSSVLESYMQGSHFIRLQPVIVSVSIYPQLLWFAFASICTQIPSLFSKLIVGQE